MCISQSAFRAILPRVDVGGQDVLKATLGAHQGHPLLRNSRPGYGKLSFYTKFPNQLLKVAREKSESVPVEVEFLTLKYLGFCHFV